MHVVARAIVDREGAEAVVLADLEVSAGMREDGIESEFHLDGVFGGGG